MQVAQGDLAGALKSYRDGLAIAERLAKSDPGNAGWQRDLSVSYDKVGDVQVAQGDLAGALKSYRDSLAIAERLAKSDPGNAGWQRDLSVSLQQGRRRAGGAGRPGRRAESPTATASPLPSAWRSPTPATPAGSAICRCRTTRSATCRWRRATWPARCKSYRDSLAIAERLAKSDPGNAGWQRDLSVSLREGRRRAAGELRRKGASCMLAEARGL